MPETTAIDAVAVVGIAARMQQLLAQPGSFLSYPLSAVAYPADDLRFLGIGGLNAGQAQALAEFSELVNRLPSVGAVWNTTSVGHLWDVYRDMLGADLARSSLSPDEQAQYQQAWSYLHVDEPGDLDPPSPAWQEYRAAQQAYFMAEAAYRQSLGTPDEDAAEAARDSSWQSWLVDGHKDDVERALLTISTLGDKDPSVVWNRYRRQFDPTLPAAYQTGLDGSVYVPTFYAPSSVLDVPWLQLTLTKDDLAAACQQAPPALKPLLGQQDGATDVQSISFEYMQVNVVRPWFSPTMFSSRAWKLPPSEPALSDGADPPSGSCPAYVSAIVLARNITLNRLKRATSSGSSGSSGQGLGYLQPTSPERLQAIRRRAVDLSNQPPTSEPDPTYLDPDRFRLKRPVNVLLTPESRALPEQLINPHLAATNLNDSLQLNAESPVSRQVLSHRFDEVALNENAQLDLSSRRIGTKVVSNDMLQRYDFRPILHFPIGSGRPPSQPSPSDTTETVTTSSEVIYLMAFVCAEVPKSPDPDPNLSW
ncbi:MAG TPA: hypothetical protein VKU87_03400 [Thermomicrobiaceae bacterium]|nr:hypothetical protein [Thermomicrobiaceae bacterium]